MSSGKIWSANDRTGGPLDQVLDAVRARVPGVEVERLVCKWPGDDDNVYWLRSSDVEVQVDTYQDDATPFLIEADHRLETASVHDAVEAIIDNLRTASPSAGE